ncbi:probably inactive leucine-rich repeat receptor-like protein kinase At3g28040 [Citrus clementina]|uniref:probably inactive leucine-rich repeat receptor-like protein kinase At3g28040 n=1 Tax=Citrus clementina TaxID=85681 RepID=UPI000CECE439|nr:probably inactive leucine-rich repeat receptor-like protein kinase At3g28040 [Citrus x clementina]
MLVFFLLTIILEGCWGTEGCLEQERSALLRLKHDFFNDPFNLENWLDDENHSDCCKWEGVECNTSTGRVKALYLSSKRQFLYSTAGQLNASLLTPFQQLETLHLDSNNIAGFVQNGERLSGLSNFKLLNLGRNLFNNSIFSSLAVLSSLRTLSLGYNRLKGSIDVKELDSLSNLKVLDMGMNEIEDFSVRPKAFTSLKRLSIQYGRVDGALGDDEEGLCRLGHLQELHMGGNDLRGILPWCLANMTSLRHDLEYVDFSDSNLKGEFPNWLLENNTNLNTLVLRNNSLSGPFRMPIQPHWHLDTLHVSKNFFQGNIPLEIGVYFPRLVYLNLSRNDFNGSIPSSIGDMNSLKFLDLSHNQLTGEIPEHLVIGCFNLEYLVLSENSLHGQLFYKKIYLRKLARLHLDANYFTGEIPKSLSNCSRLEGLYMSDNNLYGNIPAWLGNLSSLNDIMMAINHLQGPIPLEFCQLNYLEILDLSENNISGTLPSCSSHSTIQQVHLSKNMLYGPLKYGTFFNRSSIVTLDLSYNSFSGNIPYWIERLTRLRYLILANNNLEDNTSLHNNGDNDGSSAPTFNPNRTTTYFVGPSILEKEESEIPPQIGKLTSIRALNFSHNNLTGVIPVSFSNLKQVESLDVSYNNLNGKIPPQLVELNALAVFSVAHNNLSGKIPEWTAQFTTFKEDSYEGNPLLCGKPLPDCDVAAVPEASNEEDGNSLIDMGSFYITFTSSYVIVILAIIGVLYVNPYWRRRWFYLIENWMTSCFYFIVDNLIPTRFYRACM